MLENCRCIGQPEWHHPEFIQTLWGFKGRLLLRERLHPDLPETGRKIQSRKVSCSTKLVIDTWQGKGICFSDSIQSPVVHTEAVGPVFLLDHGEQDGWMTLLRCMLLSYSATSWRTANGILLSGCFFGLASPMLISMCTRSVSPRLPSSKLKTSWWSVGNSRSTSDLLGGSSGSSIVSSSFSLLQASVSEMVYLNVTVWAGFGVRFWYGQDLGSLRFSQTCSRESILCKSRNGC